MASSQFDRCHFLLEENEKHNNGKLDHRPRISTSSRGKLGRRRPENLVGDDREDGEDISNFKSKNLLAERRRRERLSNNLLQLRSLVPIITNMNKEMIIVDAINYIQVLKDHVEELINELSEMEAPVTSDETKNKYQRDFVVLPVTEMKHNFEIKPDVKLIPMGNDKLFLKLVFGNKRGRVTQLVESIIALGYHITDVSLTTSDGLAIVTCCLEEMRGVGRPVKETEDVLLHIICN